MVTVVARIHLNLPAVDSLKEKRRILKSLISRAQNSFNVSIAEVDENDSHRTAVLGAATIANNNRYARQVMDKLINKIENNHEVVLTDCSLETY